MTRAALDDIFAKAKKPSVTKRGAPKNVGTIGNPISSKSDSTKSKASLRKGTCMGSSSDPFALAGRNEKKSCDVTEEGWKIYTPAELNIGKGADTTECPFDCSCCF